MNIIRKVPNPSGAYPPIQSGLNTVPEGFAIWPDELDTTVFYEHNGFVVLTTEEVDGVSIVTAVAANMEAWEEWKSNLPEETEPEETEPEETLTNEERIAALEEQLAESDEAAIALYEAQAQQEAINAEQDEAILGIYEMIGG